MTTSTTSIKPQVRQYLLDNFMMGTQTREFSDAESLMETQILDSTGFLELVAYLEETFGIQVTDDDMTPENLDSLDAIDAYVASKR